VMRRRRVAGIALLLVFMVSFSIFFGVDCMACGGCGVA
jgi:hypothetical protein